jgi:Fe-S-cluster-containing dehydrogenase component
MTPLIPNCVCVLSIDRMVGHCVQAFSNGKIPYCVKLHPDNDKQHIFLAGMSDKKIVQVTRKESLAETQAASFFFLHTWSY